MLEALPDTLQSWTPDELEGSLSANNFNQPERSEQLGGVGKKFMGSSKRPISCAQQGQTQTQQEQPSPRQQQRHWGN